MIIFITGGARSGKSNKAEEIAKKYGQNVLYVATAKAFDSGMKDRIKKHKERRPKEWGTKEIYKNFIELEKDEEFLKADIILFDCLTLMVTNLMLDVDENYDEISMDRVNEIEKTIRNEVSDLIALINKYNKKMICVSNEVGMGLVPAYMMGNIFRDIAGRMNQLMAKESDNVIFMVSGLPINVKGEI
jgi:adenosylcobinamide kinase/adenosylcobinamide-phosphate guanylyltransferase